MGQINSSWHEPKLLLALRKRVGARDEDAMAALLQQAVAHKGWMVQIEMTADHFIITLAGTICPSQSVALVLIGREICHWNWPEIHWVTIQGIALDDTQPQWVQKLSTQPNSENFPSVQSVLAHRALPKLEAQQQSAQTGMDVTSHITSIKQGFLRSEQPSVLQIVLAGLFVAVCIISLPQVAFLLSPLVIIIHELGHAATNWLFGYPAVPAFDFLYGGGITLQLNRWHPILYVIYGGFGYLFYRYRRNMTTSRFLLVLVILYTLSAFTALHHFWVILMGHGFELLFSGIFLYRGLSGTHCRSRAERYLYVILGCVVVLHDLGFAQGLLWDREARELYQLGKGEILDHDLVRIARDYLKIPLSVVAFGFWLSCWFAPIGAWLAYRHQQSIEHRWQMLLTP
jgi:hypothetical protein